MSDEQQDEQKPRDLAKAIVTITRVIEQLLPADRKRAVNALVALYE